MLVVVLAVVVRLMAVPELHHFGPVLAREIFPYLQGAFRHNDGPTRPAAQGRIWSDVLSRPRRCLAICKNGDSGPPGGRKRQPPCQILAASARHGQSLQSIHSTRQSH